MDKWFWGESCSQAGWHAYGADHCLGAGVTRTDRPSLARGDDMGECGWEEICRKQSVTDTDREPRGLVFKIRGDLAQKAWANLSPAPHLHSGFNIKMRHRPAPR